LPSAEVSLLPLHVASNRHDAHDPIELSPPANPLSASPILYEEHRFPKFADSKASGVPHRIASFDCPSRFGVAILHLTNVDYSDEATGVRLSFLKIDDPSQHWPLGIPPSSSNRTPSDPSEA